MLNEPERKQERFNLVEKAVGAVMIALMIWVGTTTQQTATRVAVIEAKLSLATENRYTSIDAERDKEIIIGRIEALENRVNKFDK